ncbi:MAG TPA: protease pro-enzyme activation domain-containing protein, partial [bacterium]|nr:protease pro-enzyme activation domain-containing protein [bacterium]
ANETLSLSIGLPLRNQDELQQFLTDLYDPHSPLYHHFLTPQEFDARYGPDDSDYQAVIDFAKSHNLTVINTYTDHLFVPVQGAVSDIQKAFHVRMNHYQRKDGTEFHAPDQDPTVDLDVPLSHISGLENYRIPKPALSANTIYSISQHQSASSLNSPNSGTGASGSFLGSDFRKIYIPCLSNTVQGAAQTVALVEFDRYYTADITSYTTAASFTSALVSPISVNGYVTSGTPDDPNGCVEVSLDIEMVLCMSQSAQINVYEEQNGSDANILLNQIATDNTAKSIGCSWSNFGDGSTSAIFDKFAAQGQSFFQASGDTGAYITGDNPATVLGPMNITSKMTIVGGTEVTTSGSGGVLGTPTPEIVWNNGGASSGGICNTALLPIPTYQVPFINIANGGSSTYRNLPDVAWTAYNIEVYANAGTIYQVRGTSAAAPLWAGFMALINEQAGVKAPLGFLNPSLYFLAKNFYNNDFNDITSGNNNTSGSGSKVYSAVTGYDLATGLGSPKCNLIADIINPPATNTPTVTPTPTISPTPTNTPTVTNTPTPPSTNTSYAYPQPASGQVFICFNSNTAQQIQINVYSFSAQLITSITANAQNSNQNRVPIPLQGITPGVYFYVIRGSGGVMTTGKFLVVN